MQDYYYIFEYIIEDIELLVLAFCLIYFSKIIGRSSKIDNYFLPIAALPKPANFLTVYFCIVFSLKVYDSFFALDGFFRVLDFVSVSAFWIIASVYMQNIYETWVKRRLKKFNKIKRRSYDDADNHTSLVFMSYVIKILLFLFASIGIAHHIGHGLTGLLVIKAILIVILSFTAEKFIKNSIYGLILKFENPFKQGDAVRFKLHGKKYWADIKKINLRTVEIANSDHSAIIVPCSYISSMSIANKSLGDLKCKSVIIPLMYEYSDKVELIEEQISEFLTNDQRVGPNRFVVSLANLDDCSINIEVKFYAKKKMTAIREDLLLHVVDVFNQNHIPFSRPVTKIIQKQVTELGGE